MHAHFSGEVRRGNVRMRVIEVIVVVRRSRRCRAVVVLVGVGDGDGGGIERVVMVGYAVCMLLLLLLLVLFIPNVPAAVLQKANAPTTQCANNACPFRAVSAMRCLLLALCTRTVDDWMLLLLLVLVLL